MKVFVLLNLILFAVPSFAEQKSYLLSPYDVVAPTLPQDPASGDRVIGQIYYDLTTSTFRGVNAAGTIDTLSVGVNTVTAAGSGYKVNAVRLAAPSASACAIASGSETGDWVSGTPSSPGTAQCTVTFTTAFTNAPTCVCVPEASPGVACATTGSPTTTAVTFITRDGSGNGVNNALAVICMGQ